MGKKMYVGMERDIMAIIVVRVAAILSHVQKLVG
jgi:hypothetical protein